jgi:PadR family transcriptional regulator PadR
MTNSATRDLFPGALEMMVLRLLTQEPLHGYALVQRIRLASNDLLRVEEGSLYPALQRLLKAGLVRGSWETSDTNRRVRVYRLTAAGRRRLADQVSAFEQMLEGIVRVLAVGET